jgi:DNA polymerase-3 subunit epsilon
MQSSNEPCGAECSGACEQKEKPGTYNKRVEEAMQSLGSQPSFAIVDKGLNGDDRSCILVLNGKLYGMGYIPGDTQISEAEQLKDHLQPYKENSFIRNLLNGFAARYPSKLMMFCNSSNSVIQHE